MLDKDTINIINEKISRASNIRESGSVTFFGFLCEYIPYFGNHIRQSHMKKRYTKVSESLDVLIEAFQLGYVPGGIEREPEKWTETGFMMAYELYHPNNRAFMKELANAIYERLDDPKIPAKKQTKKGYKISLTTGAIMDLEGLSPPMQYKPRRLEYGNTDKNYWISWAEEIKRLVEEKRK